MSSPNYYAIIPANVRYDQRLKANEKLLFGEITALSNMSGYCYATNKYFADLYGVSSTSISLWVKSLIDFGYVKSHIKYKEGTKEILNRYLSIVIYPMQENLNTPPQENLKDNNTSIFNNTSIIKRESKNFLKPSLLEVENYILESEFINFTAASFWNFYESKNWMVGKNKMKDWKKAASGWEARSRDNNQKNYSNGKSKIVDSDGFKQIAEAVRSTGVKR